MNLTLTLNPLYHPQNINPMRFLTFILTALIFTCIQNPNTLAQSHNHSHDQPHRCNSEHKMQQIYDQHPDYQQEIEEGRKAVMQKMQTNPNFNSRAGDIITIPVHVIIVHPTGESIGQGSNLSMSKIESQITVLNEDFRRTNADAVNTPNVFSVSDAEIEFCLASVGPNGNATNGVTRYASNQNFDNNESSIKSQTGWDRDDYLNIWVAPTVGALGYAYLPSTSSLPNATLDGVVIVTTTFGGPGTGSNAPYDLGRTTTHEVGHYLGLDHIWGGGCSQDDGISDTPQQQSDNGGCPNHPSPSCNNGGDMFMNYMDYVNDLCMNAFSAGQNTYMRQILNTSRSSLLTSADTKCNLIITPPTCTDGIQNGNETGVDCGGADCPACEAIPTCNDGIQNGNETGIDCGGTDCPACEVASTCDDGIQNGDETGIDCGGTDCPACETEPTCSAPGNISVFGANENSATVTWGAVNEAVSYNLQYKSANSIDWTSISTTGTSLTIGNLQSCTQYQVRIQSVCANGGSSKLAYAETSMETENTLTSNDNAQASAKKQTEPVYAEGEILVQLQPKTPLNQFLKSFQSYKGKSTGLKVKKVVSKSLDIYLLEFNPSKAKHADFSSQIFHHKDVRIVQNNHKVSLRNTPNDTQFNQQWQYINTGQSGGTAGADIDADLAWDITTGGTNTDGDEIVVCVIDDGLQENHPDFGDNVWVNTNEIPNNNIDDDNNGYVDDYKGWNTYQNNDNLNDPGNWHGTPVAGIIGAKGNNGTGVAGVNWNVKIMFVVGGGNEAEAIAAYTYPLEMRKLYNETNGAKGAFVVSTNASWGIDGGKASDAPLWCNMYEQLGAQGILSAGATVNANTNVDVDGDLPTQCSSNYLLSVTNMNHNDQKVTQAGYGATSIDLGAFGEGTHTVAIGSSYEGFGGTSGATPHVAGTIALLYSAPCSNFTALSKTNPGAAALAVRNYILDGTDSNTSLQGITTSGGRLNVHKALQELMNANCSGATPTCNDGIQNGGETGIDCGGNCSPCETTPTCDDGIQNGNETGVDCGGDCSPCGGETVTSVYSTPISFTTGGCVSCTDGIQNGNETGVDCGGDCSPCGGGGNDDYCDASGQDTEYEWIEAVSFVNINNTSGANGGYGDFTNQVTSVEQGSTHGIVLTPGFSSGAYDEYFQVWLDFNSDGDFDDAGELAFDAGNASTGVVNGTIAIPANAAVGSTRMRIAMRWNEAPDGPCGVFGFGEVEDYTVNITAAPTCDDGIQNGNETGVDCGGSCAPCVVATCDDGIQNGNETGIDCGGSCAPCGGGNDSEYCDSYGDDSSFEYIAEVAVGDYYFSSGDDNGYADNTDIIFEAAQGSDTDLQLTPEFLADTYPEYWQVYVDFNQDGDFEDAGELAFDSGSASTSAVTGKLTVPSTATLGITTMRVQMSWESGYNDPCALIEYGEVEDYGLEITEEEEELSTCDTPTDSWVTKVQNTKVNLNWNAMPDAIKYKVRYRTVYGTDNWVYKSTVNAFKTLKPLLSGTEYEYQIRTKCPNGWTAYSEVEYFSTSANKEEATPIAATEAINTLEMSLKAYPNPADTHVQIEVSNISQAATLSIFNLAGKLMHQEAIGGDAKLQLDISGYQNGFYILQLEDGQHSKTEKLAVF